MNIPLAKPEILESDIAAVTAVLRSSRLSQGPVLRAFEKALAAYLNIQHAVAVNSGTSGLQLALQALGIDAGDEVILPSFSFMAVTNAVLAARAIPVFVDIDPHTLNLDPAKLAPLLSARTRAIIVVHTFGIPAAIQPILALARRHRFYVIEDACEALGAEAHGVKVGATGDVGIFAFYPNKQITTGEGGAVVTNSPELAQRVRTLANQGREVSTNWFQHTEAGYSYRLADVNCALGLQQLSRIEAILERREQVARCYQKHLVACSGVKCFSNSKDERISWFTYPVLLPEGTSQEDRDFIWRELKQQGIECGRYFPPAHLQPVMQKHPFRCGDLSRTVALSQRLLCLPFFNTLTETEIQFVCESLGYVLSSYSRFPENENLRSCPVS